MPRNLKNEKSLLKSEGEIRHHVNKNNHRSFPCPMVKWPPAPQAASSCRAQLRLWLIINGLPQPGAPGLHTPVLLPAPIPSRLLPGLHQAPLQHPPSLPTRDGHTEVRDTPGHCSMRSVCRIGHEGKRAGTVWRREESRAMLELR